MLCYDEITFKNSFITSNITASRYNEFYCQNSYIVFMIIF